MEARTRTDAGRASATLRVAVLLSSLALVAGCGGAEPDLRSVLLVVVDTLRADHMSVYGYERPTTPEIERWAARGAVFERVWSSSPWTLPTFGTLFTGYLPSDHGAGKIPKGSARLRVDRPLRPDLQLAGLSRSRTTLAEMLSGAGLATGAFVNNPFLGREFGMARGFDRYDHAIAEGRHARRSDAVVDSALRWIDGLDGRPFFLVAHLMDPHTPYDPIPPTRGRFTDGYAGDLSLPIHDVVALRSRRDPIPAADLDFIAGAYDEEVAFVDIQLGRMLDRLERDGRLRETLVVLTADHGEEIFEHGGFEHGHQMYEELLRVPLIVWAPGVRPRRLDTPVSLLDVVPTILDALGLAPPESLPGRSLWPALTTGAPLEERALAAEGTLYGPDRVALVRWPWKVIWRRATLIAELFDLESDAAERKDVAATHAEQLRSLLAEYTPTPDADARAPVELDDPTLDQLEALGYLDARPDEVD